MTRVLRSLSWAPLVACAALAGCTVGGGRCEPRTALSVPTPPPAPLEELEPPAPTPGMTWIAGYWHWDGVRYVWVPGHHVTAPPGQRWYRAKVEYDEDRKAYLFRPGGFGCESGDEP